MTATNQTESKSSSRRALLAGALGGVGAWAASAIGRPQTAHANDPFDVVLGGSNISGDTTAITNNSTAFHVLTCGSTSSGTGVRGFSSSGVGVAGDSDSSFGVSGTSNTGRGVQGSSGSSYGVIGYSSATGQPASVGRSNGNSTGLLGHSGSGLIPAAKPKTGVYGYAAQDAASQGVWGHSPAGNGVVGSTTTGYAGYFSGKVYSTAFYELSEIGTPAAPAPNRARLFVKDNGAGKTQLCVRFHTGAVQVIKTEP